MNAKEQMVTFRVVWLAVDGSLRQEEVRAANAEAALKASAIERHSVIECTPMGHSLLQDARATLARRFSASPKIDTVSFAQDMASLLEAGVTVKEAVTALGRKERNTSRAETLSGILADLEHGLAFSTCLRQAKVFPELLVATIVASEETGDLSTGLSRYAKHQVSLRSVRDKVVGACIYPGLLLGVGSVVVLLLLGVVVPKFSALIESDETNLPFLSKMLMDWGKFVAGNPSVSYSLPVVLIALVLCVFALLKNKGRRKSLLSKVPGVNGVLREFDHLQMYRTSAILTARGIPIHKAFTYCMDFLNPSDMHQLTKSLEEMRQGQSVSQALAQNGVADDVASSMLAVAERTGSMPEMLDRIADFYEQSLQRKIDILSKLIEPVLMIVFGFIIGGIVILMYLPIFDLASSIQ